MLMTIATTIELILRSDLNRSMGPVDGPAFGRSVQQHALRLGCSLIMPNVWGIASQM